MKKTLFALACAALTFSATAQVQVVKEAEKAMKSGKDYTVVYNMILPAMSNPETAKDAATYYIPGKAGFNQYDNLLGKRQLNMLPEGQEVVMANALIGGFDNFVKALPLDTVIDAKGKVKTKYSKDIINVITGHYNDFAAAGGDLYNAKDYDGAFRAWEIFVDLSQNPEPYGLKADKVQPDSIVNNFIMNAGVVASIAGKDKLAAETFKKGTIAEPENRTFWDYGLSEAIKISDPDLIYYFAAGGNKLFGKETTDFINNLINYYLQNEKYEDAIKYLDEAIAVQPEDAQYYALEGLIYDNKGDADRAAELYKKAVEIDPENGLANYNYGRSLAIQASKMDDDFTGTNAQYEKFKKDKLFPMFSESVKYLEKSYLTDKGDRENALQLLNRIYYLLEDEAGMKSVETRQAQLRDED